jgi:hypothetical protein
MQGIADSLRVRIPDNDNVSFCHCEDGITGRSNLGWCIKIHLEETLMKINFFKICFYFLLAIFFELLYSQSILNPYMPISTAGYSFGGMIPGSRDSIPNVTFNPAGMTGIDRTLFYINGQMARETINGTEHGESTKEESDYYQGGLTLGLPISLWKNKVYLAGTVDWNIRPDLELFDSRYYGSGIETDQSRRTVVRVALGGGFKLSEIFQFGFSINRWLGKTIQEYSIIGIGFIEKNEYRYRGMHLTAGLTAATKKVMAGLIWQSPMTLFDVEKVTDYGSSRKNHSFSGAGGAGITYRIINSVQVALGYWTLFRSKVENEGSYYDASSYSETNIDRYHSLTTGLQYSIYSYKIPVETFITYRQTWLPDIFTMSDRSRKQLVLGISSRHSRLGIHTSLSWLKDQYKKYEIPSPAS